MRYTIEDLRGKYVKTGTPEAEVFLDACTKVGAECGLRTLNGYKFVELTCNGNGKLILSGLGMEPSAVSALVPFTIKPEWSIYTNTLPLCELTYEQAGKLVNSSGMVEHMNPNTNEWGVIRTSICNRYDIYRIKQKSERELFVEECAKVMREAGTNCQDNHEYFGVLFDSGRFKLVKDGE